MRVSLSQCFTSASLPGTARSLRGFKSTAAARARLDSVVEVVGQTGSPKGLGRFAASSVISWVLGWALPAGGDCAHAGVTIANKTTQNMLSRTVFMILLL